MVAHTLLTAGTDEEFFAIIGLTMFKEMEERR